MTVSAYKTILPILALLFVLSGINAAHAGENVSREVILGLDLGLDSWGYEVGGRFGQRYASFGVSARTIGDEWPEYNRFGHSPLTTWKLTGKYNTNEGELFFKYGVFLTSSIGVEAGLGYARQDIIEVYDDPNTGLTWGRVVDGDRRFFTATAGARYLASKDCIRSDTKFEWCKRYYYRLNYHTSRGIIAGIGIMW